MHLNHESLSQLCTKAIEAAKEAGKLINSFNKDRLNVVYKSSDARSNKPIGGSTLASLVVTEVDIKCQELILEILRPTISKFDLGVLTEELADDKSRFVKDYFWCIDPLDGTLPFINGSEGYSTSIALVAKDGTPVIGVVYNPVKKHLYHAIIGHGAYKNDKQWNLNHKIKAPVKTFTFITDKSFLKHPDFIKIQELLPHQLKLKGYENINMIAHGGAVMNAIWVLEDDSPSCYFKLPKDEPGGGSLWDFAATACIFNELGAYCKNINGNPLDLNKRETTFMNLDGVIYASHNWVSETTTHIITNYITTH